MKSKFRHMFDITVRHRFLANRAYDTLENVVENTCERDMRISLEQLKDILTNRDVVNTFIKLEANPELNGLREYVCRLIDNITYNMPAEEVLPIAGFLVKNTVAKEIIDNSDSNSGIERENINKIACCLTRIIDKIPQEKKIEMVRTLAKNDFARTVFGKIMPSDAIRPLARGLLPQEFDAILRETELFADVLHDEHTKKYFLKIDHANGIALDLYISEHPEAREQIKKDMYSFYDVASSDIERVDIPIDESEKRGYKERGWKILEIAYEHCKGIPVQDLDDDSGELSTSF